MKLLAERENDGILVRLFWDDHAEPGEDVILRYRDDRHGHAFSARPPRERALHAFYTRTRTSRQSYPGRVTAKLQYRPAG